MTDDDREWMIAISGDQLMLIKLTASGGGVAAAVWKRVKPRSTARSDLTIEA
jgi:hypothetical protein